MPTPRPEEVGDRHPAVEKPGWKIICNSSLIRQCHPGWTRPEDSALALTRVRSIHAAIVHDGDDDFAARLMRGKDDPTGLGLAGISAIFGQFQTMVDGVANQMHQGIGQPIDDTVLSTSVVSPSVTRSIFLPVSRERSCTRRRKRPKRLATGIMRRTIIVSRSSPDRRSISSETARDWISIVASASYPKARLGDHQVRHPIPSARRAVRQERTFSAALACCCGLLYRYEQRRLAASILRPGRTDRHERDATPPGRRQDQVIKPIDSADQRVTRRDRADPGGRASVDQVARREVIEGGRDRRSVPARTRSCPTTAHPLHLAVLRQHDTLIGHSELCGGEAAQHTAALLEITRCPRQAFIARGVPANRGASYRCRGHRRQRSARRPRR